MRPWHRESIIEKATIRRERNGLDATAGHATASGCICDVGRQGRRMGNGKRKLDENVIELEQDEGVVDEKGE